MALAICLQRLRALCGLVTFCVSGLGRTLTSLFGSLGSRDKVFLAL